MTDVPTDELLSRVENGVLWLTINRPDKGNAIPYYVRDALIDAFRDAHHDVSVRAVVLTSAGESALLHRRRLDGAATGEVPVARKARPTALWAPRST